MVTLTHIGLPQLQPQYQRMCRVINYIIINLWWGYVQLPESVTVAFYAGGTNWQGSWMHGRLFRTMISVEELALTVKKYVVVLTILSGYLNCRCLV